MSQINNAELVANLRPYFITRQDFYDLDGGAITSVVAGDGLVGGGASGAVTIDVNAGCGIELVTDEVRVSLESDGGIQFDAINCGLEIKPKTGGGVGVDADGVYVDLSVVAGGGLTQTYSGFILLESGDRLLLETSDATLLEDATPVIALGTPGTLSVSSINEVTASSHTHAITTSSNPGAAASILASDASGYLQLVRLGLGVSPSYPLHIQATDQPQTRIAYDGSNYTDLTTTSAGTLQIAPTGDIVLDPGGDDVLPGTAYTVNLGAITNKYLTLHAAELWVETLVAQSTMATIGGRVIVAPTNILEADLASGATSMSVRYNNFASGDRVLMEANGNVEWISVDSAPGGGGPYSYTITRNLDGSGANDWYAGDAIVNTGTTGDGFIDLYSVSGILSGSGPTIVGNVRTGTTYNNIVPAWAIGNMNGLYGYATDLYGLGLGRSDAEHITIDETNGIRFRDSTTVRGQWQTDGDIFIGSDISAPATTYFIVFAQAQTYNSESIGAGDLLIGDNTANSELLTDGGLETWASASDLTNWTEGGSSVAQEASVIYSGTYAAKLTESTGVSSIYQDVSVSAQSRYTLVFWARGDGNSARFSVYDNTNAAYIIQYGYVRAPTTAYKRNLYTFVTPAACVSIRVTFYSPSVTSGYAYFDAASLKSTENANLFWDASSGDFSLRGGQDAMTYLRGDGAISSIAGSGAELSILDAEVRVMPQGLSQSARVISLLDDQGGEKFGITWYMGNYIVPNQLSFSGLYGSTAVSFNDITQMTIDSDLYLNDNVIHNSTAQICVVTEDAFSLANDTQDWLDEWAEEHDPEAMYDGGGANPERITIPEAGYWAFVSWIEIATTSTSGGVVDHKVRKNGASATAGTILGADYPDIAENVTRSTIAGADYFAASDWLHVNVYQNDGGARNVAARFQVWRIA